MRTLLRNDGLLVVDVPEVFLFELPFSCPEKVYELQDDPNKIKKALSKFSKSTSVVLEADRVVFRDEDVELVVPAFPCDDPMSGIAMAPDGVELPLELLKDASSIVTGSADFLFGPGTTGVHLLKDSVVVYDIDAAMISPPVGVQGVTIPFDVLKKNERFTRVFVAGQELRALAHGFTYRVELPSTSFTKDRLVGGKGKGVQVKFATGVSRLLAMAKLFAVKGLVRLEADGRRGMICAPQFRAHLFDVTKAFRPAVLDLRLVKLWTQSDKPEILTSDDAVTLRGVTRSGAQFLARSQVTELPPQERKESVEELLESDVDGEDWTD